MPKRPGAMEKAALIVMFPGLLELKFNNVNILHNFNYLSQKFAYPNYSKSYYHASL